MKKASCFILSVILLLATTSCGTSAQNISCDCCPECKYNTNSSVEEVDTPLTEKDDISPINTDETDKATLTTSENDEEKNESEEDTTDYDYKRELYDKAKEMYLSGEWDGLPSTLEGHTISLSSSSGQLLVDSAQVTSGGPDPVDLPDSLMYNDFNSNYEYIPGQGVYFMKDTTLVKYVRGEMVPLGGGPINWKGFNPKKPAETDYLVIDDWNVYSCANPDPEVRYILLSMIPYLYYVPEAAQLLLVTFDPVNDIAYLYLFPDYNVSEVKLLCAISDYEVWGSSTNGFDFYYLDTNGVSWKYGENGPELHPHNYG